MVDQARPGHSDGIWKKKTSDHQGKSLTRDDRSLENEARLLVKQNGVVALVKGFQIGRLGQIGG